MHIDKRPTSMLLLLVLMTGILIGWMINTLVQSSVSGAGRVAVETPSATTVALAATTPAASETAEIRATDQPTAMPSRAIPTATPRATSTILPSPSPSVAPTRTPAVAGYAGHIVAEGETLAQIAANGGSSPDLIAAYNRLGAEPQAGRALIVPRIAGQSSALADVPLMVRRGAAARPWVALTLDAGGSAEGTEAILDALRSRGVTITFFLTGRWIAENPELTRQIVADGHELANHTYTHPDLTRQSDATIVEELAETEAALREAAPGSGLRPFFRPPYGAYDERVIRVVQTEGYLPVYWTLDSLDSVGEPKTPAFLVER